MKVSHVMQRNVDYVAPTAKVSEVARLIFGRGINGVPVCRGKKLVGMITEQDILDQFYPSFQEYVEDFAHTKNFEAMEGKAKEEVTVREERNIVKWRRLYAKDDSNWVYWDRKYYDLIINTYSHNQEETLKIALEALRAK